MNQETLQNFNDPKKLADFKNIIDNIIFFDRIDVAKKIIFDLEKVFVDNADFSKVDFSLFSTFKSFLISLKFVIIFDLPDKEVIDLITNNLDFIFKYPEYDLDRKIKYKISSFNSLEQRDEFKSKIRQALFNNKTPFGHDKIIVSDVEQEATISAWLRDCYAKLGSDSVDALKINEYLVNDQNARKLSIDEKKELKVLLNFFEKMKVSSLSNPLFEENFVAILPSQEVVLVTGGQPERIDQDMAKSLQKISGSEESELVPEDDLFLPDNENNSIKPKKRINENIAAKPVVVTAPSAKIPPVNSALSDLEQTLKNYSTDSFEHKALLQEIGRLKKTEINKPQQSDDKK